MCTGVVPNSAERMLFAKCVGHQKRDRRAVINMYLYSLHIRLVVSYEFKAVVDRGQVGPLE